MNTTTAVDVFLGHPLVDTNEKHFLARLRRDLAMAGVRARILANVQVGKDFRQIDFVVVTDRRAILVELKSWRDPIVGQANGRWQRLVDGALIDTDSNGYRQAHDCGYALSDSMRRHAQVVGAPGPRRDKYFQDLELYVCLYPTVREGSSLGKHPHVKAVGYDELLRRLTNPGRHPAWQTGDWDGFIRGLGLYRDGEDETAARALRQHTAAVDEYCARYVGSHLELPELVATRTDGGRGDGRPDIAGELLAGRDLGLWGASGQGKSLWASHAAVELARAGHVPVWLPVRAYDDDFSTFLARAVAPYTTTAAAQLIASARAAGRHVVFILDGLNERGTTARSELLAGVQALRLHAASHAVLITDQQREGLPDSVQPVELCALADDERRAVLAAYGADEALADIEGLLTPLDLAVAATSASCLEDVDGPTELLDLYVDAVTDSQAVRAVLRTVAWRMHEEVRLSLRAPDAARQGRRGLPLDAVAVGDALQNRLLRHEHGRVSFVHERFAHFLAAESLLDRCPDGATIAAALNGPRAATIRGDVIALERDEGRLGALLAGLHHVPTLVDAARGRYGQRAAITTRGLLIDALNIASTHTTSGLAAFEPSEARPFLDLWTAPWTFDKAERAQLLAAGHCVAAGLLVEPVVRLFAQTEEQTRRAEQQLGLAEGSTFPASYGTGRPISEAVLPATLVFAGVEEARLARDDRDERRMAARALMAADDVAGLGIVLASMHLLRSPEPEDADLVARLVEIGLAARPYHLRLEAFRLVHDSGRWLEGPARSRVLDAVEAASSDNLFLSSAQVEALGALGALEPMNGLVELQAELTRILSKPDDAVHCKLAVGAVSSQFEDEDVLGPWCEAIESLDDHDRLLLFAMALRGGPADSIALNWLLQQSLDLAAPRMREALGDFMARIDHDNWHASQFVLANAVLAAQHLARAGLHRPPATSMTAPSWEPMLDLVAAVAVEDLDLVRASATRLLVAHEDGIADLLHQLRSATSVMQQDGLHLVQEIIAAFGPALRDVLVASLQRPDQQTSFDRWPRAQDRDHTTIRLLGEIGDARSADVLRGFVDDPALGASAIEAVRRIETSR